MLELKTFGGLRLEADGAPCSGPAVRPKTLALLALLAPGKHEMSRDKLIAYLWPETDSARGRHLLKQACHDLRRELLQPELFLGRKFLQLNPAVMVTDVQRFEAALDQGDLSRGVGEYAGPFLDGFYLDGSEEFERWVGGERERLARRVGGALQGLAKEAGARGDHATAAEWWRRLTELDPLSAEATLGRMTALAAAKERAEALKVGREHAELVQRELDAAPARAVAKLMDQLRQQSEEPVAVADSVLPKRSTTPQAPEATRQPPAGAGARRRAISGRRGALLAAGGLAAVAALAAIMTGTGPRAVRPVVAVSPIRDYSGSDSAVLGAAVTDMLAGNLARASEVQVLSTTRLGEIASRQPASGDLRAALSRAGATDVLEGALLRHPDGTLRLQLQLVDVKTGMVRRAFVAEGPDLIELVDRLTVQLSESVAARAGR